MSIGYVNDLHNISLKLPTGYGSAHLLKLLADILRFLQVYDAGHMVPMNQPEAAAYLLEQFTGATSKESEISGKQEGIYV